MPANPHKHWILKMTNDINDINDINGDKRAIAISCLIAIKPRPNLSQQKVSSATGKKKNLLIEDFLLFGESFLLLRQGKPTRQIKHEFKDEKNKKMGTKK